MQTRAGQQSVQSRHEGLPAVGQPQGLTLDRRHPHSNLSRLYCALSPGEPLGAKRAQSPAGQEREGQKLGET